MFYTGRCKKILVATRQCISVHHTACKAFEDIADENIQSLNAKCLPRNRLLMAGISVEILLPTFSDLGPFPIARSVFDAFGLELYPLIDFEEALTSQHLIV